MTMRMKQMAALAAIFALSRSEDIEPRVAPAKPRVDPDTERKAEEIRAERARRKAEQFEKQKKGRGPK